MNVDGGARLEALCEDPGHVNIVERQHDTATAARQLEELVGMQRAVRSLAHSLSDWKGWGVSSIEEKSVDTGDTQK